MNFNTRLFLSLLAACGSLSGAIEATAQAPTAPLPVSDPRITDLPRGSGGWTEQKVTAVDGMAGDYFGFSAVIQGNTALVSAPGAPANSSQGIVYVFGKVDGEWQPMQHLTASDAAPVNQFGDSLAMSGDTVFISAPSWPGVEKPYRLGAAYVFRRVGDTWFQTQMLTLADSEERDTFGRAIGFDGTTAMIASNDGGTDGPGAIHVYTNQAGIWTHTQKLNASGPTPPGGFGREIEVSGDTALATAIDFSTGESLVYVLKRGTDGNWTQTATITSPQVGDFFGRTIAFTDDGKAALVGAMNANVEGDVYRGAVYVLGESVDGTWATTQMLSAADGMPGDRFGPVDVDGDSAIITAIYADDSVGAAYVFRQTDGIWKQQQRLAPSDGVPDDAFGIGAISGTTALVGAYWANVEGDLHRGAAYFYSNDKIFAGGFETPAP